MTQWHVFLWYSGWVWFWLICSCIYDIKKVTSSKPQTTNSKVSNVIAAPRWQNREPWMARNLKGWLSYRDLWQRGYLGYLLKNSITFYHVKLKPCKKEVFPNLQKSRIPFRIIFQLPSIWLLVGGKPICLESYHGRVKASPWDLLKANVIGLLFPWSLPRIELFNNKAQVFDISYSIQTIHGDTAGQDMGKYKLNLLKCLNEILCF